MCVLFDTVFIFLSSKLSFLSWAELCGTMADANQKPKDQRNYFNQTLNNSNCGSASYMKSDGEQSPNTHKKSSERTRVNPCMLQCHSASPKSTFASIDSPLEDDQSQCSCVPVTKDDITNEPVGQSEAALPIRLLLVSSKIRNASAIQQALNSDVIMLPYKYDSSTLENILGE